MIMGSKIIFFPAMTSTNVYASQLLKDGILSEGTVIYTNFQKAGRGYFGNTWESEDGKNLLFSIILYPSFIRPEDQFCISMAISLAICDFLGSYITESTIKWPNDIYVKNDKIAGILIDSALSGEKIEYSVAGIGLNINQDKFSNSVPNPVSLQLLTGRSYNITDCLNKLLTNLDIRYKQLISAETGLMKKEYISKLYRYNEWHKFMDITGSFNGRINTVADDGRVVIEREDSQFCTYAFKEVEFII
jgi:BirA family transcriptional regulator, biotin operon repressor / biotin---[acetyl-CoA-carboxylase] ligase